MRGVSKSKEDEKWLKELGERIEGLIKKKGYSSSYDFWVNAAGDHISRSTLNYILAGESDAKITTLRVLAKLLDVKLSRLLDF